MTLMLIIYRAVIHMQFGRGVDDETYLLILVAKDITPYSAEHFKVLRDHCISKNIFCIAITEGVRPALPESINTVFTITGEFEEVAPLFANQLIRMLEEQEPICIDIADLIAVLSDVRYTTVQLRMADSF